MENLKKVSITLKEDTIKQLQTIQQYIEFESKYKEFPQTTIEDLIKAAIYFYLNTIEMFSINNRQKNKTLSKPYQLKNRFKEILDKKGMTQEDLSEITGINRSNISHIFNNKNQPSLDYFTRIWVALDCLPITEILYREDDK